jgi:hypothetical protein
MAWQTRDPAIINPIATNAGLFSPQIKSRGARVAVGGQRANRIILDGGDLMHRNKEALTTAAS